VLSDEDISFTPVACESKPPWVAAKEWPRANNVKSETQNKVGVIKAIAMEEKIITSIWTLRTPLNFDYLAASGHPNRSLRN
jgi:hypothetical protein